MTLRAMCRGPPCAAASLDPAPERDRGRRRRGSSGSLKRESRSVPHSARDADLPSPLPPPRGTFRSKPHAAVMEEARSLVASGALELNLIAEDTNQYGSDRRDGTSLARLLAELATIDGLKWIRLLYCYPSYFDDALIEEIASNDKVCKYIDIPLQHVHNLTLLAMNRPPRAHTDTLLAKLRARVPGLALRTTFICGFPGETAAAHRELVDFCADFRFERMGAFAYSAEDGTPAATMPEQVDGDTRAARRDELISLQQRVGAAFAEARVGETIDVLVDGFDADGQLVGRTQWDAPDVDPLVFISDPDPESGAPPAAPGTMVRCVVTSASLFDLEATPVSGPI